MTGKSETVPAPRRERLGTILTVCVFLLIIFGFFIANIIYTPPKFLYSERRAAAVFTPPTLGSIKDKSFMTNFDEKYSLDSFIGREKFRSLKANFLYNIYMQRDNGGIYVADGQLAKIETLDEKSAASAADKINKIITDYLKDCNVYYSVIPDKGYYLAEANGYPAMDYEKMLSILGEKVNAEYIDIFSALSADSYYKTDLHWNQQKINGVVDTLADKIGFSYESDYAENVIDGFYGVYYGQSGLAVSPEQLVYLTSDEIIGASVKILDTKTLEMTDGQMYYRDEFSSIDPYNFFLSGPESIITIENPSASSGKELILFRDSYGSSIAPLLVSSYSKITLVDLRYIASPLLAEYVDFTPNADALFMYGTLILNSSGVLLVK